jgi:hypothetical protein
MLDAGAKLLRALRASAALHGCDFELAASINRRWASATFVGGRHELTITHGADAAAIQWLAGLPEAELSLPGHLVADLEVAATESDAAAGRRVTRLEALTVEAA